ncbi:MAG TPA: Trk system potassium transporter TrkA [Alphaproteobacteria bacterium]|nr:Trk system potassium transporter TrkA [Alphaproteobacteria bacterium]
MRVIICGAGQVGFSIASYLSRENNDVTVIDHNPDMIARVNRDLDANGITGSASSPEILDAAGANDADMIIAVTHQDEVNMVACQVAHSLFNVPKKVARIRNQVFRDSAWANLFSRAHMPIDVIISPEREVAKAVDMRLSVPGTTTVTPMGDGNVYLCGVICEQDCPLVNTPLRQLQSLFPDMPVRIVTIVRNGNAFIPKGDDQMLIGDEVLFVAETVLLKRILSGFGHEEQKARNVIIVGGGNIGLSLINMIKSSNAGVGLKVIESNPDRATKLSEDLEDVLILNASGLDRQVLEEANIAQSETLIAVTDNDETNILACLLARQYGCGRVIPLINKESYTPLTGSLGLGAVVSPKAITVSTIMRHVRRGRVKAVHNLLGNFAEVMEIEASEAVSFLNTPLRDVGFPQGVVVCAIIRDDNVIIPDADSMIKSGDHVIILASQGKALDVEKMFLAQVDLF